MGPVAGRLHGRRVPLLEVTDVKSTADGGFIFAETAADYAAIRKVGPPTAG